MGSNGSSVGYGPLVGPGGTPSIEAQFSLGRWASSSVGMAIAPGGPVVVALGNDTLVGLNATTLRPVWYVNLSLPIAGGPSIAGSSVYAISSSGEVFAVGLDGVKEWSYTVVLPPLMPDPDLGAAPLPLGGDLYLLTEYNVTVLNATTGALLFQGPNDAADPSSTLAAGPDALYAQVGNGNDDLDVFSLEGQFESVITDPESTAGAAVYSDGTVAVGGTNGGVMGDLLVPASAWGHTPFTSPVEPLAVGEGLVLATDGSGPIKAYSLLQSTLEWTSPSWVSSAATLAGPDVLAGANDSVVSFSSSTGQPTWVVPTPGAITAPLAVANGLVYAVDSTGTLSAIGTVPLKLQAAVERSGAANTTDEFTASWTNGSGAVPTVSWLFSDGSTGSGTVVNHTFTLPGPAWAEAVGVDPTLEEVSTPSMVSFTVLPALTVVLYSDNPRDGPAPLWVNFTGVPSGGSGSRYTLSFQVTEVSGPESWWSFPSGLVGAVEFNATGTFSVTAWVTDPLGDNSSSINSLLVVVSPAVPVPSSVVAFPSAPGTVEVEWSSAPLPWFQGWFVNSSVDGSSRVSSVYLPGESTGSYLLTGQMMGEQLWINVSAATSYGTVLVGSTQELTTPLLPPVASATPVADSPGQALLTWSLPAPIDHFSSWDLLESFPGASSPVVTPLPAYVGESNTSFATPTVPDGTTVDFAIQAVLSGGSTLSSAPVAFSPLLTFASVAAAPSNLQVSATWNIVDLPGFSHVTVCYGPTSSGPWTCPLTSTSSSSPAYGQNFTLPRGGAFVVNVTAYWSNGFSVAAPLLSVTATAAPAAPAWYAAPFEGIALWLWAILILLLLGLLALGYTVYRERTTIPPYLGEVLPWDPLAPELEPHAKPTSPETLQTEPKLHRHRSSHPHRHLRTHGNVGEADEAAEEEGDEPQLKSPRKPAPKATASAPATSKAVSEDDEEAVEPRSTPTKSPRSSAKIDEVTSSEEEEGEDDTSSSGTLAKLPVVLRHRDADDEGMPSSRAPSGSKKGASTDEDGKDDEDGDEEGEAAPAKPKKPAIRPKPSQDEEPTL